jgi:transcriptional regulator with GAF, ATPase, and Fis domain
MLHSGQPSDSRRRQMDSYDDSTLRGEVDIVDVPRIQVRIEKEGSVVQDRGVTVDGAQCRLGSYPGNEVVLHDRKVSRFHCTLVRDQEAWRVVDTGSLNGTFLNGVRVRDADLPRGVCRLALGESEVVIQQLDPVSQESVPVRSNFGALVGSSLVMRQMFSLLERVARSDATVVIEGESGTGKELIAAEIVRCSSRAKRPFVVIDCSTIAPDLVESELFGHARGAFTGAERERIGAFESANGGTVFLDEVGELPLALQPKLLRVLESRQIRRVGETKSRTVDVRVVTATNRKLEREVNHGRFREDLFFRLSVVTIRVPPLRTRLEDIPLLVDTMLASLGASNQWHLFENEVLESMARYDWPGNVRELRNYVERAVVLDVVEPAPASRLTKPVESRSTMIETPFKVAKEKLLLDFERRYLSELLRWSEGKVGVAARKAEVDRMHLYRLMHRHGIKRDGQKEE